MKDKNYCTCFVLQLFISIKKKRERLRDTFNDNAMDKASQSRDRVTKGRII